jgi:hypothetical protein
MGDYYGAMGTAIFSKLAAGTALISALGGTAIYSDQAPDNTALPYVVFRHVAGGPDNITPRDMRSGLWDVFAYASTRAAANVLDGHISDLLHKGRLSVTGWTEFWMVRESDFALVENLPNGERIYMAGADYRIRISE